MEAFVLDASVALSWCFPKDPTENTPYSRAILNLLEEADALVPEIWPFEIANSLVISFEKRKRITEQQIREYVELLSSLPIRIERRDWLANIAMESLARKHHLTAYDIAYLDLAMRHRLPLATLDRHLKKAALAEGLALI